MVQSRIDPTIIYEEKRNINEEDLGFAASIYDLDVYDDLTISVVIGKPNMLYSKKNILFMPIYLVSATDKIKGQIGVFELRASSKYMLKLTEEEDLDEEMLGEPLLYKFATREYLERAAGAAVQPQEPPIAAAAKEEDEPEEDEDETDEEDEVFRVKVGDKPAKQIPAAAADRGDEYKIHKQDQIFHINEDAHRLPALTEETAEDTRRHQKEFEAVEKTEWVEKFFKNNNFKIHRKAGYGDCFFEVVRDAFQQIGYETTIEKLRKIVADEMDDATLEQYLILYKGPADAIAEAKHQKKRLQQEALDLKRKLEKSDATKIAEHSKLIDRAKKLKNDILFQDEIIASSQEMLREFRFLEGVDTLEKLRHVVMTQKYWADDYAIQTIERALRIKMIILSEQAYEGGALDFVLNCGQRIEGHKPYFYIMTTYSGAHYELISYKAKNILSFAEIPHAVKTLIVNKCMERAAGSYNEIPEFRELQREYGAKPPEEGDAADADAPPQLSEDICSSNVQFMFHINSANVAVGKGTGETVEANCMAEFIKLNTFNVAAKKGKKADGWRRMLDDEYIGSDVDGGAGSTPAAFELNGKRWAAVEIYYQAAKFRKQNPDFYQLFSLDSGSEFSTDVEKAKIAGSLEGKKRKGKDVLKYREKSVKIDADFYDGTRNKQERAAALYAKFSQNSRLKEMLLATKRALLKHFERGHVAEPDLGLMEIRDKIGETENS